MTGSQATGDRFRVSSLLARQLSERQVSVPAVLRCAGLPPHFLQQESAYATTVELFALWAAIAEVSGDPGIGLSLGAEPRFERYDATQIAAVCSRTFRDALQRIGRCKVLTCPEEIRVRPGFAGPQYPDPAIYPIPWPRAPVIEARSPGFPATGVEQA
jgi:hypothetical protein